MAKGRGGGKTPERLVLRLNQAIASIGQSKLEQDTGLSHSMISRYKRGIGEPTTETFQKLADYFQVSVAWLRGDKTTRLLDSKENAEFFIDTLRDVLELYEITPLKYRMTLLVIMEHYRQEIHDFLYIDNADLSKDTLSELEKLTNKAWNLFYETEHHQQQPVKESGQDHKQQRKAPKKKAKP